MRERKLKLLQSPISATGLAELLTLLKDKTLTQKTSRLVFAHLLETNVSAKQAIKDLGLGKIDDPASLQPLVDAAIAEMPQAARAVAAGTDRAIDALKGLVMRKTRGRADPGLLDSLLRTTIAANS